MLETLMGNFVKKQELEAVGTPLRISKNNVLETVKHVATSQIDVRFSAAATLSRILKKKVSQLQALEFRKECARVLAIIVSKIQKSPLQCNFARMLACLDPRIIVSKPESAVKMFQQVLNRLIEEKWKASQQADAEHTQYRKFISEAKKYNHNKLSSYSFAQKRLDMFLSEQLDNQRSMRN